MYKPKDNYKDIIFVDLFENNKNGLLEIMNAILGTEFNDAKDLEIVTIKDKFFVTMYNDIAFICTGILNLYEHQSTINPNMPLRLLCYVAEEYQNIVNREHKNIYGKKLQKIPTPKFVVFYNGINDVEDRQILKLSDAFLNTYCEPDLDLSVLMININYGHNDKLMKKCQLLENYSKFIDVVKEKVQDKDSKEEKEIAFNEAIDYCISNDILSEYLTERRSVVLGSLIRGFDKETYESFIKEEAYEEGIEQGIEQERCMIIKTLLESQDPEKVAEMLKISVDEVKAVK